MTYCCFFNLVVVGGIRSCGGSTQRSELVLAEGPPSLAVRWLWQDSCSDLDNNHRRVYNSRFVGNSHGESGEKGGPFALTRQEKNTLKLID